MIRVLIVDDHPVVREGLATFLDLHDDVEVVGHAATGGEALAQAAGHDPDVVLLDLRLPDGNGLARIPQLLDGAPDRKVVVLTSFLDDGFVRQAIQAGASGYLVKHASPDSLLEGIRAAARGDTPMDPQALQALTAPRRHDPIDDLTPREREVLAHLAQGRSNREVAGTLVIAEKTVKTHVSAILAKLGVADRTQAALYAKDRGL